MPNDEKDAHTEGCRAWREAAPGQRKCVCSVGWPERASRAIAPGSSDGGDALAKQCYYRFPFREDAYNWQRALDADREAAYAMADWVRGLQAQAWDEGFQAAYNEARNWGHVDYWEDWPKNPWNAGQEVTE